MPIDTQDRTMTQIHENGTIELQNLHHQHPDHSANHVSTTESSPTATFLPAADGGLAAWRLLIAAFVFEALLWGQSLSLSQLSSKPKAQANQVSHSASASSKPTIPHSLNSKTRPTLLWLEQSPPERLTWLRRLSFLLLSAT